ncbi:MAG: signal recognition particle-docking protein FtsY [Myxococcota bacterium]|nr:signal recognition particle-docking protein FtsY [Myxococcota bacterium]
MGDLPLEVLIGIAAGVITVAGIGFGVYRSRQRPALEVDEPARLPEPPPDSSTDQVSLAARFFTGLSRSRAALSDGLARAFGGETIDEEALEALEDALISADVGVKTAMALTETLRKQAERGADPAALHALLRSELRSRIGDAQGIAEKPTDGPLVILVVGINGSGKTTSIGKLANLYKQQGRSVILAAGDTFRAGAIEQLKVWGERAGVPVIAHQDGSSPSGVVFDALKAGVARGADVVICDTAGRLQAHRELMEELEKVNRSIGKVVPGAPHEVLIVLDATIGQNALSQARAFKEAVGVTGVVLTKLDGTAKGGVVVAVRDEIGVPVKLVGLGEGIDDLRDFDPDAFVDALIGVSEDPG